MKVDITFVNFPVTESIRSLIVDKIESRVSKFNAKLVSVKAFFSVDGDKQRVRLSIIGDNIKTTLYSFSFNLSKSVDLAIDKLETKLRKSAAKQKHKKYENNKMDNFAIFPNINKRIKTKKTLDLSNEFVLFEKEFIRDFEDFEETYEKVG